MPLHSPSHKKLSSACEEKKSSTPNSLQKSQFYSYQKLSRFTSTVMRKIENSRVGTSSFKTPMDCSTLLKTPTMRGITKPKKIPKGLQEAQFNSTKKLHCAIHDV
ncbi:hypothetical protein ACLB2K_011180 [Fragaria x ananassa]